MLEALKQQVYHANMLLPHYQLITFTWGNVSAIDRESGLVAIKPSGVEYEQLAPDDMVIVDLEGNIIEGRYKPSSDTATHLRLYQEFPEIGGIVHTHSPWAVVFAQAGLSIPAAGTTQADYFAGDIPVTRAMKPDEILTDYEKQTGDVIIETFKLKNLRPERVPGVLVNDHGPFAWGKDADQAVHNAVVLEEVAKMTYHTLQLNPRNIRMDQVLLDKHFNRKHGPDAYYGQSEEKKGAESYVEK